MWPSRWFGRSAAEDQALRWLVLDVETTGLDVRNDHLLAIAAVAVQTDGDRMRVLPGDSFEATLRARKATSGDNIAPSAAVDKANILVHGIGVQAQLHGTEPAVVLRAFGAWAAGAPLLGFHVGFDRQMICRAERAQLGRAERVGSRSQWIDIEALAAISQPQWPGHHSLDEWMLRFGVRCARRHQAAADALATAELLMRLWPALHRAGARSASDLHRLARGRRWLAS